MLHIGCHLSTSGGYTGMGKDALKIGADTFAFFTRNPRGGNMKVPDDADIQGLIKIMQEHDFAPLVAHAPYTYNLCSDKENIREFARNAMKEDLQLLDKLPGNYYNFHPGSQMKQGIEVGVDFITSALNEILYEDMKTTVLLEAMAGKGTEVGSHFEELRMILDRVELSDKMGVCIDTCHIYDAGYDIVNHLDDVIDEFDRVVGLERLKAVHINDSKNPFASHKDRHERIGQGSIGVEAFERIVNHPALKDKPFILETPTDLAGYAEEITLLRNFT